MFSKITHMKMVITNTDLISAMCGYKRDIELQEDVIGKINNMYNGNIHNPDSIWILEGAKNSRKFIATDIILGKYEHLQNYLENSEFVKEQYRQYLEGKSTDIDLWNLTELIQNDMTLDWSREIMDVL